MRPPRQAGRMTPPLSLRDKLIIAAIGILLVAAQSLEAPPW